MYIALKTFETPDGLIYKGQVVKEPYVKAHLLENGTIALKVEKQSEFKPTEIRSDVKRRQRQPKEEKPQILTENSSEVTVEVTSEEDSSK